MRDAPGVRPSTGAQSTPLKSRERQRRPSRPTPHRPGDGERTKRKRRPTCPPCPPMHAAQPPPILLFFSSVGIEPMTSPEILSIWQAKVAKLKKHAKANNAKAPGASPSSVRVHTEVSSLHHGSGPRPNAHTGSTARETIRSQRKPPPIGPLCVSEEKMKPINYS